MEAATTTLERRVREIPPTRKPEELLRNYDGKMRVAAYCRVSTDSEEQLNSYEAQKTYYTQKIQDNPDWEMAGIYADEGISGTSLKKRAEFNKMITACKRGRIDFIITKSLSRFARNTVDCLDTVRLLKANGIGVYFEKENINTLTESSEFLVTLFSGFAQAESESLSKNVAWGKEKSAKAGNVHFQYKKIGNPRLRRSNSIWREKQMMNTVRKSENLLPFPVISAAANGDTNAMCAILKHYEGYIAKLCTRTLKDDAGNTYSYVDEEMRNRLQVRLITRTLAFHVG